MTLHGKTMIVGITGGIAAYKAVGLCSSLVQQGATVQVIMTEGACRFVTPLTLQAITRQRVITDVFAEDDPTVIAHIDLARRADAVVVAPATAHALASMALGLGTDMLTTTLLAVSDRCPILVAPAMNPYMWSNAVVRAHVQTLQQRGIHIVMPESGFLACGDEGVGRMADPERIVTAVRTCWDQRLAGKRVLITAGGTVERLDAVRCLTNFSSGKMGIALAQTALNRGATVTLITGRVTTNIPDGVRWQEALSAQEMYEATRTAYEEADIVLMAAAVADYRPQHVMGSKRKKSASPWTLILEPTVDILAMLGKNKRQQILVGFAAETEQLRARAHEKMLRKNCDFMIANDVSQPGIGFDQDNNAVVVLRADGAEWSWGIRSKQQLAENIWDVLAPTPTESSPQ